MAVAFESSFETLCGTFWGTLWGTLCGTLWEHSGKLLGFVDLRRYRARQRGFQNDDIIFEAIRVEDCQPAGPTEKSQGSSEFHICPRGASPVRNRPVGRYEAETDCSTQAETGVLVLFRNTVWNTVRNNILGQAKGSIWPTRPLVHSLVHSMVGQWAVGSGQAATELVQAVAPDGDVSEESAL